MTFFYVSCGYCLSPRFLPHNRIVFNCPIGQCFSLQGVIYVNFGKKNETSTVESLQPGSNCLYQDACNFENRILHQFKKLAGINLDVMAHSDFFLGEYSVIPEI